MGFAVNVTLESLIFVDTKVNSTSLDDDIPGLSSNFFIFTKSLAKKITRCFPKRQYVFPTWTELFIRLRKQNNYWENTHIIKLNEQEKRTEIARGLFYPLNFIHCQILKVKSLRTCAPGNVHFRPYRKDFQWHRGVRRYQFGDVSVIWAFSRITTLPG